MANVAAMGTNASLFLEVTVKGTVHSPVGQFLLITSKLCK